MSQKSENAVKRACKELGITQKELAERLGMTETTVSSWARGATPLPDWAKLVFGLLVKERRLNIILDFARKTK